MNNLIVLENVNKYYHNQSGIAEGITKVSLNFNIGEFVAISGKSGSGKTTLLNLIACLDKIDSGKYYFNNQEIGSFDIEELEEFRKQNVSFIFQEYNLVESYNVLDNIMIPLLYKGLAIKDAKKRALELVDKVGLRKVYKNKVTTLSGGEQQRCVIARALAKDAPIIACDEPTGNLDKKTGREIINLLKECAKDKLILFVTHSPEELDEVKTRQLIISDGKVIEDNKICDYMPREYVKNPSSKAKNIFYQITKYFFSQPKKAFLMFLLYFIFGFFLILLMAILSDNFLRDLNEKYHLRYHLHHKNVYEVYKKRDTLTKEEVAKINNRSGLNPIKHAGTIYNETLVKLRHKQQDTILKEELFNLIPQDIYAKLNLSQGRLPKEQYEVVYITKNIKASNVKLDDKIIFYNDISNKSIEFTVVGLILEGNANIHLKNFNNIGFTNQFLESSDGYSIYYEKETSHFKISSKPKEPFVYLNYLTKKNTELIIDNSLGDKVIFKTKLALPYQNNIKATLSYFFRFKEKTLDINLDIIENNYGTDTLSMSEITLKKLVANYENRLFYYYNGSAKSLLNKLNEGEDSRVFSIVNTNDKTKLIDELDLAVMIITTISIVLIVIATIILSLIMNLFIKQIFKVKQKDYTIFRTLGGNKKDINKFVILENFLIANIAFSVFFIIIIILKFSFRNVEFMQTFHNFNLLYLILFYALLVYIALSTSIKYLTSLYKKQISTTLSKGGSKR